MAHAPHQQIPKDDDVESIFDALVSAEMGDALAAAMREVRRAQEARFRSQHPDEGLRERKGRLTRQLISDAATALFVTRGFDEVKVSEVAERVGVSEKTIYNYFPTKESMVLDTADEMVDSLATALRERTPEESITDAVVRALEADMERFDTGSEALEDFIPAFVGMIENTPALHAAWLTLHARLATVITEELAIQAAVDPRDPEPTIAGNALVGLITVGMESRVRRTQDGLRGQALTDAVINDVRRAARLLDTGLWSFRLPRTERTRNQAMEAARAAEEARRQVVSALREARAAWDEVRRQGRDAGRQVPKAAMTAHAEAHRAHAEAHRRAGEKRRADAEARRRRSKR